MTKLTPFAKQYIIDSRNKLTKEYFYKDISKYLLEAYNIKISGEAIRKWYLRYLGKNEVPGDRKVQITKIRVQAYYDLMDNHTSLCRNRGGSKKTLQIQGRILIDRILQDFV